MLNERQWSLVLSALDTKQMFLEGVIRQTEAAPFPMSPDVPKWLEEWKQDVEDIKMARMVLVRMALS